MYKFLNFFLICFESKAMSSVKPIELALAPPMHVVTIKETGISYKLHHLYVAKSLVANRIS